jgi:hypothetical protein
MAGLVSKGIPVAVACDRNENLQSDSGRKAGPKFSVKYQLRFYMEPLVKCVHQQWFIVTTVVNIHPSTAILTMNRC